MGVIVVNSVSELLSELDSKNIQGAKRYEVVRRYLSYKARIEKIPISGSFELTPLCNLDCKMCYVHLSASQCKENGQLLSVDEWKLIIE